MSEMNQINVSEYYAETYYQVAKDSDVREDRKLIKIFENDPPYDKRILDVGCGPGVTLKYILLKFKNPKR